MSDSIYATPEADVTAPPAADGSDRYYVVAPLKFLLLSILTFGLYFVYWFYQNWRQIKESDNSDIWPVPRAIFYIFFAHALLADVDKRVGEKAPDYNWNAMLIATAFVILTFVVNIISNVLPDQLVNFWTMLASFVLSAVTAVVMLQGQKAINIASGDAGGTANRRITPLNVLWMTIGGLLWAINLYVLYLLLVSGGTVGAL